MRIVFKIKNRFKNIYIPGPVCPGLDLHFWRKICNICKCRKDHHQISLDDSMSGWAQFDILGQIRSKSAFIKISILSETPQNLEWVPPNVSSDIVKQLNYNQFVSNTKQTKTDFRIYDKTWN